MCLWAGFCPGRLRLLGYPWCPIRMEKSRHSFAGLKMRMVQNDENLTFWMAKLGIFCIADPTYRIFLVLPQNKAHGKQKGALPKASPHLCCESCSLSPVLVMGKRGRTGMLLNWLNLHTDPYVLLLRKERRKKKTSICNGMKSGKMGPKTLCNSKQLWEFWAHKP